MNLFCRGSRGGLDPGLDHHGGHGPLPGGGHSLCQHDDHDRIHVRDLSHCGVCAMTSLHREGTEFGDGAMSDVSGGFVLCHRPPRHCSVFAWNRGRDVSGHAHGLSLVPCPFHLSAPLSPSSSKFP